MKNKPCKWGIKVWCRVDSSGFLYGFKPNLNFYTEDSPKEENYLSENDPILISFYAKLQTIYSPLQSFGQSFTKDC